MSLIISSKGDFNKTHCIRCGAAHIEDQFPKTCTRCRHMMFVNPLPVAVVLIPVKGKGILLVKRAIPPFVGSLALVGGYVDQGETAQEAACREAMEEVGVKIDPELELLGISGSSPTNKHLLVYFKAKEIEESDIKFKVNNEVSAIAFAAEPMELAFPNHTEYLKKVLSKK